MLQPTPAAESEGAPSADGSPPATEAPATTAGAALPECPDGMALVEGEYCFEVRYECFRSTAPKDSGSKHITWEDFCFDFRPGSARCGTQGKTLVVNLLPAGVRPTAMNEAEPNSPLAQATLGKRAGDEALGCRISAVNGMKDMTAMSGRSVELACPPKLPLRFCIDRYEHPNMPGDLPERYYSWYEAKVACQEDGKRLCYEHEWTLACEGPELKPYPYGWHRDNGACNTSRCVADCENSGGQPQENRLCRVYDVTEGRYVERPTCPTPAQWMTDGDYGVSRDKVEAELDRLDHATGVPGTTYRAASGSRERCVSDFGVRDLPGNVDEWTQCFDHCEKYPSNLKGGHFLGNVRNRCRPVTTMHGPQFRMHSIGFRCCAEPTPPSDQ